MSGTNDEIRAYYRRIVVPEKFCLKNGIKYKLIDNTVIIDIDDITTEQLDQLDKEIEIRNADKK